MQSRLSARRCALLLLAGSVSLACAGSPKKAHTTRRSKKRTDSERLAQVAVGSGHTCVRFSSGRVRCFGANADGQIGDGTRRTRYWPRDVAGLDDATAIAAGGASTCAVHRGGAVSCWGEALEPYDRDAHGRGRVTTPTRVPGIGDAIDVSVGHEHACAIRRGGKVSCWGAGESGELGDGKSRNSARAVEVAIDDVVALSAASATTCAVKGDGSTWCWGRDHYDLFGSDRVEKSEGGTALAPTPIRADRLPKLKGIRVGSMTACGIEDDGAAHVRCWGPLYGCAVGYAVRYDDRDRAMPVAGVRDVEAIVDDQCIHDESGVVCWEEVHDDRRYDEDVQCTGNRIALPDATSISMNGSHGCAIVGSRELRCWGSGGTLGTGTVNSAEDPTVVADIFAPDRPDFDPYVRMRNAVPNASPLTGTALVWGNAELLSRASEDAVVGRFEDAPNEDRYEEVHRKFIVSIAKDHGEFIEIATVASNEARPHCGASARVLTPDFALRLFVRRDDLVPVIADEYADSHEDGSTILLAPGTTVTPKPFGIGLVIAGAWVPMYVTGEDLALSYTPSPVSGEPIRGYVGRGGAEIKVRFFGNESSHEAFSEDLLSHAAIEREGDQTRLVMRTPCRRLEATVDEIIPPPEGGGGGAGFGTLGHGREKAKPTWTIPAGAATYFNDGTRAGTRRSATTTERAPQTKGPRMCWSHGIELCHDAADVVTTPGDP